MYGSPFACIAARTRLTICPGLPRPLIRPNVSSPGIIPLSSLSESGSLHSVTAPGSTQSGSYCNSLSSSREAQPGSSGKSTKPSPSLSRPSLHAGTFCSQIRVEIQRLPAFPAFRISKFCSAGFHLPSVLLCGLAYPCRPVPEKKLSI